MNAIPTDDHASFRQYLPDNKTVQQLLALITQAPAAIAVLSGPQLHYSFANHRYQQLFGLAESELLGQPLRSFSQGAAGQQLIDAVENVFATGEPTTLKEFSRDSIGSEGPKQGFYDFTIQPVKDDAGQVYGILNMAVDVTEQVLSRKKLEEGESRFRRLFESNLIGIITWNLDGFITQANDAFLNLVGYTQQDVADRKISWADMTPAESWPATQKGLEELATLGYFNPFEKQFLRKDQSRVDVILGGAFYEGSTKEGICYILNITEEKRASEKRAYLLQLSDALKGISDPQEIQYEAAQTLGRYLGADRVGYAEDYGDGRQVTVTRNYTREGLTSIEGVYLYDDYGPELVKALREGNTVIRSHIAADPFLTQEEKDAHAILQLGATLNTPLLKNGRLIGILFMHYSNPHSFSNSEIELIKETAEMTRAAVESAYASKELRASEEKYRTLFETMDQGFCIVQMLYDETDKPVDYLFIECNPVFEAQTGLVNAEGKTAKQLVPDLEEKWFQVYGQVGLTGQPTRFIDGSEPMHRWFEVYAFRISNPAERKVAVLFTDISERRKAELELQASEASLQRRVEERTMELAAAHESLLQSNAYLQNIINKFETAICSLTPVYEQGKIVDFVFKMTNEQYSAYSRLSPEEAKGKRVLDVFPEYQKTDAFEKYADSFETGRSHHWLLHYNVDQLDVHLVITCSKMNDEIIVHINDVTELKSLQLDLLQKNKELRRSNENLEEFAHAASHDLKEPIRKIHFFTNQVKEQVGERLKENEIRIFHRIENAAERMGTLVDDLLLYSHVSQRPVEKEAVDLNQKVKGVLDDLELAVQEQKAVIDIGLLPTVMGYRRQLQQLFQNLLSNAIKYTKAGEPPRIRISADQVQKDGKLYHRILVVDEGIGFDQSYAEKIFQMFARLHGRNEYSGTGVGLSIVKKVVDNHEGLIEVESAEGKGARFSVYLPV